MLSGSKSLAVQVLPALIRKYAGTRAVTKLQTNNGVMFEVAGAGQDFPSRILVKAGTTINGFKDMEAGKADLVIADRQITPQEAAAYGPRFGDLTSDTAQRIVALQALAVVMHPDNPLLFIEADRVRAIMRGEITHWRSLGINYGPIRIIGVEASSTIEPSLSYAPSPSADVISKVSQDRNSIGIVPLSQVSTGQVQPMEISACEANHRPIHFVAKTEEYPFINRLYMYLPPRTRNKFAGRFVAFAEKQGQAAIRKAGAIDLSIEKQSRRDQSTAMLSAEKRLGSTAYPIQIRPAVDRYLKGMRSARRLSVTFRFRTGSSVLDSRAVRDARRLAKYMRESVVGNGTKLILFGFADSRGSAPKNLMLSRLRAKAVADQLALENVSAARTEIAAVGEDLPVACNTNAQGLSLKPSRRSLVTVGCNDLQFCSATDGTWSAKYNVQWSASGLLVAMCSRWRTRTCCPPNLEHWSQTATATWGNDANRSCARNSAASTVGPGAFFPLVCSRRNWCIFLLCCLSWR